MPLPRVMRAAAVAAAVGLGALARVAVVQASAPCEDLDQSCAAWAKRGECEGTSKVYMATNCRASCRLCPGSCLDESTSCDAWSTLGECSRNPAWSQLHCPASCGFCPAAAPAPAPGTTAPPTPAAPPSTPAPTTPAAPATTAAAATAATTASTAPPATTTTAAPPTTTTAAPARQATTTSPLAPVASGQCGRYEADRFNTDLAGTLLATAAAGSADQCCGLCDGKPGCAGFSFTSGTCFLKGNLQGTFASAGCHTRVKAVGGSCQGFTAPQFGVDLNGNLIGGLTNGAVFATHDGACCDVCRQRPNCQGFSYLPSQEKCYLKTAVPAGHATYPQAGGQVRFRAGGRRLAVADLLV